MKFGSLYACRLCGRNWVLDDDRYSMSSVPDARIGILNEWNENKLLIGQEDLKVLDYIGGTFPNYWMGHNGVIEIPCSITMSSGECIDPAIVWITKRPPIDTFTVRLRLYRDIMSVGPSRFALPMEVRRAAFFAPEVCMGFSPTRVVAKDGRPYVLHWATSIFGQDGLTGSEIRLSHRRYRPDEQVTVAEGDAANATYFFADWFEGAEDLNKAKKETGSYLKIRSLLKGLLRI